MVGYSNWKKTQKSVRALSLDPENPRMPPSVNGLSEAELIEELALHEDVYDVARSIARNGYFPTEPVIAVRESNRLIVVEGNRRLAACKLLLDPGAAPESLRARFRTLAGTVDPAFLKKIPVIMAPSRESTIPLMIARHTSTQLVQWEPAMKSGFYARLVRRGMSIDEIADDFAVDAAEVRKSVREHSLYQMACRLKLPTEVGDIVRNPRSFPLTNLARIFENPWARDFFGVEPREDGEWQGKVLPEEFAKGLGKAVSDIARGHVDSRSLHSASDIKKYLETFPSDARPDVQRKGSFDSSSFLASRTVAETRPVRKAGRKARKPKAPTGLIPRGLECNVKNQRVRDLFNELQGLSPTRFPNACAVGFRCFMEVSVYCYLQSKREIAKMKEEYESEIANQNAKLPHGKPRRGVDPKWTPTLDAMMKRLADPTRGLLKDPQVTKALGRVILDEKALFTFNLLAHNPDYNPSEHGLRSAWKNMEGFFNLILVQ